MLWILTIISLFAAKKNSSDYRLSVVIAVFLAGIITPFVVFSFTFAPNFKHSWLEKVNVFWA